MLQIIPLKLFCCKSSWQKSSCCQSFCCKSSC